MVTAARQRGCASVVIKITQAFTFNDRSAPGGRCSRRASAQNTPSPRVVTTRKASATVAPACASSAPSSARIRTVSRTPRPAELPGTTKPAIQASASAETAVRGVRRVSPASVMASSQSMLPATMKKAP